MTVATTANIGMTAVIIVMITVTIAVITGAGITGMIVAITGTIAEVIVIHGAVGMNIGVIISHAFIVTGGNVMALCGRMKTGVGTETTTSIGNRGGNRGRSARRLG